MLAHTLVLPESDARLAARLLREAIDDLDRILLIVLGRGEDRERIVAWADTLAGKRNVGFQRAVVWIRKPDTQPVREVLDPLLEGRGDPVVLVLNFHDRPKKRLEEGDRIDPLALEIAFLEGTQP